ncbi:MAG: sensor histidine kinase N-terminal domain-containing protein [Herminiimonas sp.]|nr:sensor histidine kinase N-terminal domain-containing protein [Herminiimonas sp.]
MPDPVAWSLRRRLLVRLGVPLSLILIVGAVGTFAVASHIGAFVHDRWLLDSAMTLAQQIKPAGGRIVLDLPKSAMEMFEWDTIDHVFEQVRSEKNGAFFGNAAIPMPALQLSLGEPIFYNATINGHPTRIVAVAMNNPAEPGDRIVVQVAETMLKRKALVAEILTFAVPLQIAIFIIAVLAILIAVKSSLRFLNNIAAELSQYNPDALVPVAQIETAPLEIKPLLNSINQLIAKVADAQETQSRFIANATHQLRTPLATLQVQTERALREVDPTRHREALAHVKVALERLGHLARQLLTLARSERSAEAALQMRPVDLVQLARDEIEEWVDAAILREIDLGLEAPASPVSIDGEPHLIREMIGNLVDNAIRYGNARGAVTIGVFTNPVRLYVDNDGERIPPLERSRVLERFYRRTLTTVDGCGLGLAIANEIAERHSATLIITDSPSRRGTRVSVVFTSALRIEPLAFQHHNATKT